MDRIEKLLSGGMPLNVTRGMASLDTGSLPPSDFGTDLTSGGGAPIVDDFDNWIFGDSFNPIPSIWGGGSADPSGINGSNPVSVNPNPTGGWQNTLLGIMRIGLQGLQVYENGSTAAATPRALHPATTVNPVGSVTVGGTSFSISTVLFVLAGVIIGGVLIHEIAK